MGKYLRGETLMETNLCKILIVDDEFIIRQGIVHFLDWEKEGFTIVGEASNGQEALELIENTNPHIILCDIVMPIMDGVELSQIVKQKYPQIKIIVLSSYSDFDNVKQMFMNGATDYILKPTLSHDVLMASLKKTVKELNEGDFIGQSQTPLSGYLSQLLLGFSNDEKIEADFLNYQYFYLFATSCKGIKNKKEIKDFFEKGILEYCDGDNLCLLNLSDELMVMVLGFNHQIDLESKLKMIVKDSFKDNIFVLSNVFNNIDEIKNVYDHEISDGFKSRFYLKNGNLIGSFNRVKMIALDKFDMHIYNELLYMMQLKEALKMLKEYVRLSLLKQGQEKELKSLVGNCLYSFIAVLEEHNLDPEYIRNFKLTSLSALDSSKQFQLYYQELGKIIDDLNVIVDNYQIELNQDVMNQIIKYLHKHYQDPLTLYDLADHFGFSYSYLSSYFNERSDLTFNECLSKIRIQKAAELLRSSKVSISDIGYQVGFSDHSYFCKVFKKQMGLTPSVYRKGSNGR